MSNTLTALAVPTALAAGLLLAAPSAETATTTESVRSTVAAAQTYEIDNVHSTALFEVLHLGAGHFIGRFNEFTGTFTFDGTGATAPSFDIAIPVNSVDTNNSSLDGHLKSPDFFNAVEHPNMTFKSTSATKTGDKTWDVTGDFTMLGVTKKVTAKVLWTGTRSGGRGTKSGMKATFQIDRSDYGMMYGVENGALGDTTFITVALESKGVS